MALGAYLGNAVRKVSWIEQGKGCNSVPTNHRSKVTTIADVDSTPMRAAVISLDLKAATQMATPSTTVVWSGRVSSSSSKYNS